MKRIIFFLIGCLACFSFADPTATVGTPADFDLAYIYYHADTTFTDSNTVVINANDGFLGVPQYILIDANGTDTSFVVSLWIDPTEIGETESTKKYLITSWTLSTATGDYLFYVIPSVDSSSNTYGGFPMIGKFYIGIRNAADATLDDLKLWIYFDTKKAAK